MVSFPWLSDELDSIFSSFGYYDDGGERRIYDLLTLRGYAQT